MTRQLQRAVVIALCWLSSPVQAAGVQLLETDPSLAGAIWYPCAEETQVVPLGRVKMSFIDTLPGTKNCQISGTNLPLVLMAHGLGGWFGQHEDTARALADAGFVVAAINYPGDNGADKTQSEHLSNISSRPKATIRLLNFMLNDWHDRAVLAPGKIGFFGFSAGAYTGLILVGGTPDFGKMTARCRPDDRWEGCEDFRTGKIPSEIPHEPRIRAAVLADTALNYLFPTSALSDIRIPLLIWRSEFGGGGVDPKNSALVAAGLPGKPETRTVPAGHFAFLAPCTPQFAANLPRLCKDPEGFDRAAFHRELNDSVVDFLRKHL